MNKKHEPATRDELIAVISRFEEMVRTGIRHPAFREEKFATDGELYQMVRSILEREPPKLVPCGVCGAAMTFIRFNGDIGGDFRVDRVVHQMTIIGATMKPPNISWLVSTPRTPPSA